MIPPPPSRLLLRSSLLRRLSPDQLLPKTLGGGSTRHWHPATTLFRSPRSHPARWATLLIVRHRQHCPSLHRPGRTIQAPPLSFSSSLAVVVDNSFGVLRSGKRGEFQLIGLRTAIQSQLSFLVSVGADEKSYYSCHFVFLRFASTL